MHFSSREWGSVRDSAVHSATEKKTSLSFSFRFAYGYTQKKKEEERITACSSFRRRRKRSLKGMEEKLPIAKDQTFFSDTETSKEFLRSVKRSLICVRAERKYVASIGETFATWFSGGGEKGLQGTEPGEWGRQRKTNGRSFLLQRQGRKEGEWDGGGRRRSTLSFPHWHTDGENRGGGESDLLLLLLPLSRGSLHFRHPLHPCRQAEGRRGMAEKGGSVSWSVVFLRFFFSTLLPTLVTRENITFSSLQGRNDVEFIPFYETNQSRRLVLCLSPSSDICSGKKLPFFAASSSDGIRLCVSPS